MSKPIAWGVRTSQGDLHSLTQDEAEITNFARRMKQQMVCLYDESVVHALRARIDALMLEYEPDEMTAEQLKTWAAAQKSVHDNVTFGRVDPCPL